MAEKMAAVQGTGLNEGFLRRLRNRARYGLLFQEVLDRMRWLGVRIEPIYIAREGLLDGPIPFLEAGFEEYKAGFLTGEEAEGVSGLEGRARDCGRLLREGMKCFGVRFRGEVVSFVWCNFRECHHFPGLIPLKENEAYLFGGYTLKAHRGKNIAPYARYQLYKELAKSGRTRLYSITTYFNTSSRRFKEKLNARPVGLYLVVWLFQKWKWNFHIKTYGAED